MPGCLCHLSSFCNETNLPVHDHVNSSLLSKRFYFCTVNAEHALYTWEICSEFSFACEFSKYQLWPSLLWFQSKVCYSLNVPEWIRQHRCCISSIWTYQTLPSHWHTVLSTTEIQCVATGIQCDLQGHDTGRMNLHIWPVPGLEQINTIPA